MLRIERRRRRETVARKFSGRRAATEGSHSFEGDSRENFFNNRNLIMELAGECVPSENFEVVDGATPIKG